MLLFDLHPDVAPSLSTLLDSADLYALTSVSSTASRSLFLSIRDARTAALVLPPVDQDRAQKLLRGLDPVRLTRFQWIQVATPWHIQLLVECGLVDFVQSVRVEMIDMKDSAMIAQICEKLPVLTSVTKLSVSHTPLVDITPLSRMLQLRDLDLSYTQVKDVSCLAALTQLESLCAQPCNASDWSCVQYLTELTVLKAASRANQHRFVSLATLTKLRTLELQRAIISADDLLALTASLDHLQLRMVTVESAERLLENQPDLEEELAYKLTQLRALALSWPSTMTCLQPTTFSRRSRFNATSFVVSRPQDMETMQRLTQVEKLSFQLPHGVGSPEDRVRDEIRDFSPLLGLPQLSQLGIKFGNSGNPNRQDLIRVGKAVGDVVRQLVQLKHVSLDVIIDPGSTLADLQQVESLEIGLMCRSFLTNINWISRHQHLHTLKITCSLRECDLSGIASLVGLQHLELVGLDVACGGAAPLLAFLAKLTNLKTLVLDVDHVHDYAIFRGMNSLESLTIRSWCAAAQPKNLEKLAALCRLRKLDIGKTNVRDVAALAQSPYLRSVFLHYSADCTPLATCDHPTLLKIDHDHARPGKNCLWACEKRDYSSQSGLHL